MLQQSIVRPTEHPDLALHQRSTGRAESPAGTSSKTLYWVHGLGESGLCFEGSINDDRLAAHRHVALDLPGYGKSLWAERPLRLEQHALVLANVLEQRDEDGVVLIGHSMGGVIGQLLCEHLSGEPVGRIAAFINVEGNQSIEDCGFSSRANAYPLDEFLDDGFLKLTETLLVEAGDDRALRDYYPSVRFCDPRAYHLNSRELVSLSTSEELASRMAALDVPSLYLFGDPGGAGKRSQELLAASGVEVHGIRPAGHWPFLDQPTAFVDHVVSFLAKVSD